MAIDYAAGIRCTWHGPLEQAGYTNGNDRFGYKDALGETFWRCCPICGNALEETGAELFWSSVRQADRGFPQYEDMMRWSEGKCFPDFDTLQNAYRQAKEE